MHFSGCQARALSIYFSALLMVSAHLPGCPFVCTSFVLQEAFAVLTASGHLSLSQRQICTDYQPRAPIPWQRLDISFFVSLISIFFSGCNSQWENTDAILIIIVLQRCTAKKPGGWKRVRTNTIFINPPSAMDGSSSSANRS